MTGQRIGQYRILERLGEGGMGTVYRALDEMLAREVALKMLRPDLVHRADVVERFRSEAMTLARLDHPAIARLYGLAKDDAQLFMVMEFVPGDTLLAVIERDGALPWRRAVSVMDQLLDGLSYAHGAGVVHRDVKPANLIVRPDGRVKVTDFGIARVLGSSRATKAGHIVGTLEYMAPEQIRGEDVDARTDLYAAAIVFHELLTGRVPFSATTEYELMQQQLNRAAPSVFPLAGTAPAWCDALIQRGMAKAPADRFASAEEFRRQLQAHLDGEPDTGDAGERNDPKATRIAPAPVAPTRVAPPLIDVVAAPRLAETRLAEPPASPSLVDRLRAMPRAALAAAAVVVAASTIALLWQPWRRPAPPNATPAPLATASTSSGAGLVNTTPPSSAPIVTEPPTRVVTPPRPSPAPRAAEPPTRVTEPPAPGTERPAPIVEPPTRAVEPPPAIRPSVRAEPPTEFREISMLVSDGKKTREQDAVLRLETTRLVVCDRKTGDPLRTVAYTSIESATYSQSKQPRWKTATAAAVLTGVLAAPLFFMKSTKHWLTLEGSEAVLVLRLDKDNYRLVLPELRRRSGITVDTVTGSK